MRRNAARGNEEVLLLRTGWIPGFFLTHGESPLLQTTADQTGH